MPDSAWLITNDRYDARTLAQFNSVCTVSNGYVGLKGNLQEDHAGDCPVTLVNGIYDELDMFGLIRASGRERPWLDPAHFDTAKKSPAVANLPNPLHVRLFLADREVSLQRGRISDFRQELDLSAGVYRYSYEYHDGSHGVRIEMSRFASLVHPHRVYVRYRVTPRDRTPLRILSGISAAVRSNMTGERQFDVVDMAGRSPSTCFLHARTRARQHDVHLTVANHITTTGSPVPPHNVCAHDSVYTLCDCTLAADEALTLDRLVCISTSDDARHGDRLPTDAGAPMTDGTFDAALDEQHAAWRPLWDHADVQIDGDDLAQRYLRFCIYHLLAAAPRFTDRLSVPVKLLSGDYYQGNTFYDTDTYIVPFYTFTFPEFARTCLNFRYEGLAEGRKIAAAMGYAGTKFAWQSGPRGEECLGDWYWFPRTNIHINGDVAYALMQYARVSGDTAFLDTRGAELLAECARFLTARATRDEATGEYDFHNVAGPDEAHCHSTTNFYTNYFAMKTLRWAAETCAPLLDGDDRDLLQRLNLQSHEPGRWREVARRLRALYDHGTRLYEQCAGFFQLPPPPPDLLEHRQDWFVPLAYYQAMNQPDVLMALALFRDDFPPDVRRANWDYYRQKSMDFSSMSFAINAIMATDVGAHDDAYRNFLISAGLDLDPALTGRNDTHAGLHGTALGGSWMAAIFGFAGVDWSEKGLRIDPTLPAHWRHMQFTLALRGRPVRIAIDRESVSLQCDSVASDSLALTVAGQALALEPRGAHRILCRTTAT